MKSVVRSFYKNYPRKTLYDFTVCCIRSSVKAIILSVVEVSILSVPQNSILMLAVLITILICD